MAYSNLFKDEQTLKDEREVEMRHQKALNVLLKSNTRHKKYKKIYAIIMIITTLISIGLIIF